MIVFTYMQNIAVPFFTGIVSNLGLFNCIYFYTFVIQMTKNILILEGDHMSIKKNK